MSEPELVKWRRIAHATEDMFDFRVRRMHFGKPYTYAVQARAPSGATYNLAEFTTSAPLTDALRDTCINLVRCAA
jgi:uncharacterized circularly permuted ATP-grasp superfamily protein